LTKELIINAPQGVEIALLEDKKLVELHNEKADANFAVETYIWERLKN
jgi:ribonuclease G